MDKNCGCCEGTETITPEPISNRPGLDALTYRVGTHGSFFESMKARLSNIAVEDGALEPKLPLHGLTTRDPRDPAIAFLDGWATVADVLTFYQERIANEGYLRTATERRSILELARLVGYTLRPGVASTVYLAYTIDENQVEPTEIPLYARSQSVPGPGELPQSFETVEKLDARAKWNKLQPRLTRPQTAQSIAARNSLYVKGVATNLRPNDPLLIGEGDNLTLYRALKVEIEAPEDRTVIQLERWEGVATSQVAAASAPAVAQEYKAHIQEAVTHALEGAPASTSNAVKKGIALLRELDRQLQSAGTVQELDQLVGDSLAKLNDLRAGLPASATVVRPWLDDSIQVFEKARGGTAVPAAAPPVESAAVSTDGTNGSGNGRDPGGARDEFAPVMQELSRPPSVPPRNALQLTRSIATAFAPRSDLGLQVVSAMQPQLKALLPVAVANVQATRPNSLQVYALRTRAGVYGNTAPKRPITDDAGKVVATAEWPINGSRRIEVRLYGSGKEARLVQVLSRSSTGGFQSLTVAIKPDANNSGGVGDLHLDIGSAADLTQNGLKVDLIAGTLKQTLVFKFDDNAELMTLSSNANDGVVFTDLAFMEEKTVFESKSRVSEIFAVSGRQGQPYFAYATEVPLQPLPWNQIALDAPYEQLAPGGFAVVVRDSKGQRLITRIQKVTTAARNDYNFPAKVTQLTLNQDWLGAADLLLSDIRETQVLTQSEKLEPAEEPIDDPICGADQWIELDDVYSDLKAGRWLIVAGERANVKDAANQNVPGLEFAELVMLADVKHDIYREETPNSGNGFSTHLDELPGDANHTFIRLAAPLAYCYARDKVTIYGNVVKATHGESRSETLGAGNGREAFQSFGLKQPPVTFVPAPTAAGAESTLRVYVNNVRWYETDALIELAPTDHDFLTKTADDGKTTVIFGDGKHGARLPTGQENVRAEYRQGLGKPGNVRAKQISLLQTRPLGVKDVINPLRASGGADPESRDQARKNVPLGVMALDRLVSVQDYQDLTRTFAGIGKAYSTPLSDGQRELVHVTIAGDDDIPIDPTSDLYRNLVLALRELGDPDVPVRVELRELMLLAIQAGVRILPDRVWDVVVTDIRKKLYEVFSFENRELGQDVVLSQVISAIQNVDGVASVDVDAIGGIPEKRADSGGTRRLLTPQEITGAVQKMLDEQAKTPAERVVVNLAGVENGEIRPAQLAFLSPAVPDLLILNQIT